MRSSVNSSAAAAHPQASHRLEGLRHDRQCVDDRALSDGAADTERPGHPRRIAAFQILAQLRQPGISKLGRSFVAGHRRMGRKKHADAANAVVEVRAEAYELGKLGVAQPIETDPGDARAAAYGVMRQLRRDPIGLGDEGLFGRRDCGVFGVQFLAAPPLWARSIEGIEFVFSRMTWACQAISRSSKFSKRSRARSRPEGNAIWTELPFASPMSWPSLGETKCGTLSATSAVRSARCNGQSGLCSLCQSDSLAMKSACADQITPSSMAL